MRKVKRVVKPQKCPRCEYWRSKTSNRIQRCPSCALKEDIILEVLHRAQGMRFRWVAWEGDINGIRESMQNLRKTHAMC